MPPVSVLPISGRREGVFVILEAVLPEHPPQNIGILLIDPVTNRGWVRIRREYPDVDDAEVLEALEPDIAARLAEDGAERYLQSLEDSLSNVLRIGSRRTIAVDAFSRAVETLYAEHVEPVPIAPFRTHLPLYSLQAAAGGLGEEMESSAEGWVPAPEGMQLTHDLFVGHVTGRSMEPRIPDGSLNLFRFRPVGSRQGKIVLVELFGAMEQTARYTIKRYTSIKKSTGDDQWEHERIRLEPLNPEFEAWDVGPQDFAVVAEWLRVIE